MSFGHWLYAISPRARGCCLPLCHSHLAGRKSWGWPTASSLPLSLPLPPFSIENCVFLSRKGAEQHRAVAWCCYSERLRGLKKAVNEVKD